MAYPLAAVPHLVRSLYLQCEDAERKGCDPAVWAILEKNVSTRRAAMPRFQARNRINDYAALGYGLIVTRCPPL